jgi:hypothetical protein
MAAQAAANQQTTEIARRKRAAELAVYGDGVEFTPETLQAATVRLRKLAQLQALAVLEMGRALVWVRENLGDGADFDAWLEASEFAFSRGTAYRYMAVARRLGKHLSDGGPLAALPAAKLYALLELPDQELAEIAAGTSEVTPDAVDRMTATELRREVRRLKERVETGTEQVRSLKHQVSDLEIELDRRRHSINFDPVGRTRLAQLEMEEWLEKFSKCETGADLVRLFGANQVAQEATAKMEHLAALVIEVCRKVQPTGTRVQVEQVK